MPLSNTEAMIAVALPAKLMIPVLVLDKRPLIKTSKLRSLAVEKKPWLIYLSLPLRPIREASLRYLNSVFSASVSSLVLFGKIIGSSPASILALLALRRLMLASALAASSRAFLGALSLTKPRSISA